MCILFLYVAKRIPQNSALGKKYIKLIIAANRDEYYVRPSKPAQFWEADPNILAGQDIESGGTWLGINKRTGRLAALTNIMGGTVRDANNPKISRGALITDYLVSSSTFDGPSYCMKLHKDPNISEKFNKFNLLTVDLFPSQITNEKNESTKLSDTGNADEAPPIITYYSNATNAAPLSFSYESEADQKRLCIYGLSNSLMQKPFQKVLNGCRTFEGIIRAHNKSYSSLKNTLCIKHNLLHFLKSTEKHFPDPQLENLANEQHQALTRYLSSAFVCIPPTQYGTRTHTIILVDSENQVDFHEWTMTEPINTEAKHPTWMESNFKFQLSTS